VRRSALIGAASLLLMVAGTTWPFVVAVLAPVLRVELGLSATLLGIAYAAYYLSGSLWSTVAGRIVDRAGFRAAAAMLLVVSVVQHVMLASARGPVTLLVSGAVGGLALALTNPVTNSLISALLSGPAARRVVGVKQTGVPLTAFLSGAVTPVAAVALGWRGAVLVTLAISAVATLLVVAVRGPGGPLGGVLRSARGAGVARGAAGSAADAPPPRRRFGIERYVLAMGIITSSINGYLVLFVVDTFDGSVQRAGTLVAAFAVSGAVGRITWASLGGGARTMPILRTLGSVGTAGLVALTLSSVEWGVWVAVVVLGLTIHAWQGLGMVAVIEADRSGTVGATSARVMRDFYVGFVIGAPVAGALIDRVGFRAAWATMVVVALLAVASLRGGRVEASGSEVARS
jgi:predicted MFS family arabinose efflux permease